MSYKYCGDCKYRCLSISEKPCCNCYGADERPYWIPEDAEEEIPVTDDKNISMIKSIIDEAMEKRDRTVMVYISGENMHVSVTPLGEDEPRWIAKEIEDGTFRYVCPTCGESEMFESRYCRTCGEALKRTEVASLVKACNNCANWGNGKGENSPCRTCLEFDEFVPNKE